MLKPHSELMRQSNNIGVEFLRTEVETALIFLDVARTTVHTDNCARNIGHAKEAYATVQRLLPRVVPSPGELRDLELKLGRLRKRLLEAGCSLEA